MRHINVSRIAGLMIGLANVILAITVTNSSVAVAKASITAAPSANNCELSCFISDFPTRFWWHPMDNDISTTITAATRLIIIDDATNATLTTSLIFNDLPDGYAPPPMNEAGTQTWDITYTAMGGEVVSTKLTYPTRFTQYPSGYYWRGQFPTVDSNGQSSCLLQSGSSFRSYPPYQTMQPEQELDHDGGNGLEYTPVMRAADSAPETSLNPADPILQSCAARKRLDSIAAVRTAQYLTVTSVERRKASVQTAAAAPPGSASQPGNLKQNSLATPAPDENTAAPAATADVPKTSLPQETVPIQTLTANPTGPAITPEVIATAVITGAGFSFTLEVPDASVADSPADSDQEATTLDGQIFVPLTPGTPFAGTPQASGAMRGDSVAGQSLTIVDGRTFVPIGIVQSLVPDGVAPFITVAGSTLSPVTTVAGLGPVYQIAGQALAVGSSITVGSGANAQTLALSIDGQGTTVLLAASAGVTQTSALEDVEATPSGTEPGTGDAIASGLGETRIGFGGGTRSSVAVQTASIANRLQTGSIWLIVASLISVIIWS